MGHKYDALHNQAINIISEGRTNLPHSLGGINRNKENYDIMRDQQVAYLSNSPPEASGLHDSISRYR